MHKYYICGLTLATWLNSSHKRFVVKGQYIMLYYNFCIYIFKHALHPLKKFPLPLYFEFKEYINMSTKLPLR